MRRQVQFQQGNLLRRGLAARRGASTTSIFCRNLLIYFDRADAGPRHRRAGASADAGRRAVRRARRKPACCSSHGFVSAKVPLAFAFRKRERRRRAAAAPGRRPVAARSRPARPPRAPPARPRVRTCRPAPRASRRSPAMRAARRPSSTTRSRLADQGRFAEAARCCEEHLRRARPVGGGVSPAGPGARRRPATRRRPTTCYRKALYLDPQPPRGADPSGAAAGATGQHGRGAGPARPRAAAAATQGLT